MKFVEIAQDTITINPKIINEITTEDLLKIGDILGYVPNVAKHRAKRFLFGLVGQLDNWNYDETINFGNMSKLIEIFNILLKY